MSYILDALRKSESERRQGRVPDLGQQVQLIHKPKKKSSMVLAWIGMGLVLNAAVLGYVFWPQTEVTVSEPETTPSERAKPAESGPSEPMEPEAKPEPEPEPESEPEPEPAKTVTDAPEQSMPAETVTQERPTIIVPSRETAQTSGDWASAQAPTGSVPHLVELPLEFQKSIPDLIFNSHIYGSEPSSRRVMINNNYLKAGEMFSGIRVEQITEEGVVLSKSGRMFRVGIVRDWVSPE